ncbi:hypothetical protein PPERSA_04266 [Pseudocohnilembus persalinus]|uniref:Uncharacterized protein n=1 Tax=Pseudocohnilembus persalinus TaxID=266149 RepID=A0A0V0QNC3_PSEPJ|nr:hypothetical protein PPERSA_04266 [Pseudocohnilembus persalinus]|eukprot:KRX03758.1 hypothetical protein PPERSA_04266 [Pseudocohnilembus persalinus]
MSYQGEQTFQLTNPDLFYKSPKKKIDQKQQLQQNEQHKKNQSFQSIEEIEPYKSESPPPKSPMKKLIVQVKESDWMKKERHWKNIVDKLDFKVDNSHYDNYPILPGVSFFQAIAKCERKPKNIKVRIPPTLVPVEKNGQVLLYSDEQGYLKRELEGSIRDLEKKTDQYNKIVQGQIFEKAQVYYDDQSPRGFNEKINYQQLYNYMNPLQNKEKPYLIQKYEGGNVWETVKQVLDVRAYQERGYNYDISTRIEQQFLFPHVMKAQSLRICYFTKNSNIQKQSYAYKITNKQHFFDPTTKLNQNLVYKFCTSSKEQDSFIINPIKGVSLKPYEEQCANIVKYLEQNYPVRIEQIVLDFMQDFLGNIFITGCRYIKLQNCKYMKDYLREKNQDMNDELNDQEQLDQVTCSVICKLCGLLFKKDDASKTLTHKLLYEFNQHLQKRKIFLPFINVTFNTTRKCRVCNLCYMLVVQEHELIEIEQKLSQAMKIPIYDPVFRVPVEKNKLPKNRPALLQAKLNQYRLMFYMSDIQDILNNIKKPGQSYNIDNLYIQYKICNQKTSWKLTPEKEEALHKSFLRQKKIRSQTMDFFDKSKGQNFGNKDDFSQINQNIHINNNTQGNVFNKSKINTTYDIDQGIPLMTNNNERENYLKNGRDIEIKFFRLHYFFAIDNDIQEFLENTELVFRITDGPNWNNLVAEGKSKTISFFQNKQVEAQRHSCRVMIFFDDAKYCNLYLNCGLVCDEGKLDTQYMNLYKYNGIYFPDESYYNCNILPDIWMELFDVGYIYRKEEIKANQEYYQPTCDEAELNHMIDVEEDQKRSKKYKGVQSKFRETQKSFTYIYDQARSKVVKTETGHLNNSKTNNTLNLNNMTTYSNQKGFNRIKQKNNFFGQNYDPNGNNNTEYIENQENINTSNFANKKNRIQSAKVRSISYMSQNNTTNPSSNYNNNMYKNYLKNSNNSSFNSRQKSYSILDTTNPKNINFRKPPNPNPNLEERARIDKLSQKQQNSLKQKSQNQLDIIRDATQQLRIYNNNWQKKCGIDKAQFSQQRLRMLERTVNTQQQQNSAKISQSQSQSQFE